MRYQDLLLAICLVVSASSASRVTFDDESSDPPLRSILRRPSSSSSPSTTSPKKRKGSADYALEGLEELRRPSSPQKESSSGSSESKLATIMKPIDLTSSTRSNRRRAKKEEDVFITALKSAFTEFEHLFISSNHSYYTPEELEHRRRRRGETRDYNEIAARMSRPFGLFLVHLMMCYNFPFSGRWMLMLAIDALALAVWKHYDADWMMSEIGHWDYLVGAGILILAGGISVVHQIVTFVTEIFFLLSPAMLAILYLGVLIYGRLHREVY